jgi:hypothetical protein
VREYLPSSQSPAYTVHMLAVTLYEVVKEFMVRLDPLKGKERHRIWQYQSYDLRGLAPLDHFLGTEDDKPVGWGLGAFEML